MNEKYIGAQDGDVSEVSESLSWYEEDKTSVLASVNLMMDKVQLAQHSISNMVLMMVIGVAKSLAGVVSAFLEGLLYKVHGRPESPTPILCSRRGAWLGDTSCCEAAPFELEGLARLLCGSLTVTPASWIGCAAPPSVSGWALQA